MSLCNITSTMILKQKIVFILILQAVRCTASCPDICECEHEECGQTVECTHMFRSSQQINNICRLTIYGTNMLTVRVQHFRELSQLQSLRLQNIGLATIQSGSFQYLNLMTELYLDNNKLQRLESGTFNFISTPRLEMIYLCDNKISFIAPRIFANLLRLKKIDLTNNRIGTISTDMFFSNNGPWAYFETLFLSGNKISFIAHNAFEYLKTYLTQLHLHNNSLETIDHQSFQNLQSIQTLNLNDNPFNCDCHLQWLTSFFRENDLDVISPGPTCHTPMQLLSYGIHQLSPTDLWCAPTALHNPQENMTLLMKSSVNVQCPVSAEPDPTITWELPAHLSTRSGHTLQDQSLLLVNPTSNFSGHYKCHASNGAGVLTLTIFIIFTEDTESSFPSYLPESTNVIILTTEGKAASSQSLSLNKGLNAFIISTTVSVIIALFLIISVVVLLKNKTSNENGAMQKNEYVAMSLKLKPTSEKQCTLMKENVDITNNKRNSTSRQSLLCTRPLPLTPNEVVEVSSASYGCSSVFTFDVIEEREITPNGTPQTVGEDDNYVHALPIQNKEEDKQYAKCSDGRSPAEHIYRDVT